MRFHRDAYVFLSRPGSAPEPRRPRQVPVPESELAMRDGFRVSVSQRVRGFRAVMGRRMRAAGAYRIGRRVRGR